MISTALTTPARTAYLPGEVYSNLSTKARADFDWKNSMMKELSAIKSGLKNGRGMIHYYAKVAAQAGVDAASGKARISATHLRKLFDAYQGDDGEWALLDSRRVEKDGPEGSALDQATVEHWIYEAEKMQHTHTKKKVTISFTNAWKNLIRAMMRGEDIPGFGPHGESGTWQDLFIRLHPGERMKKSCPWNLHEPPPGHSLNNFRERQAPVMESIIAQRGLKELQLALPKAYTNVSNLRPMEVLELDDVELNMEAWVINEGGLPELVKINALCVIDVRTRRVLWAQFYPATERADGTKQGIERRHVQHALAWVFGTYGYPLDFDCLIRSENATAAVTQELAEILARLSNGRIEVSWTKVFKGAVLPAGFQNKVGGSWLKPRVEAQNNKLAIYMGTLPGQQGSNWTHKPGDADARTRYNQMVIRTMGNIANPEELKVILQCPDIGTVRKHFLMSLHDMETDPLHELQGFEEVILWRHGAADPEWKPVTHPLLQKMLERHGRDYVNDFLAEPGHSSPAKETIRQAWERLYHPQSYETFTPEMLRFLWMHTAKGEWIAFNQIKVNAGRKRVAIFYGDQHKAKQGQEIWLTFDPETPKYAVLVDKDQMPLGHMRYQEAGDYGDHAARVAKMKEQEAASTRLMGNISRRHLRDGRLEQMEQQHAQVDEVMTLIKDRATTQSRPSADVVTLLSAVDQGEAAFHMADTDFNGPSMGQDFDLLALELAELSQPTNNNR